MGERGMAAGDPRAKDAGASEGHALAVNPLQPIDIPSPPRGISKRGRKVWQALWESPVGGALDWGSDQAALTRWIGYYDRWYRVFKQLESADTLIVGSQGQDVLNPLSTELQRLESMIRSLENGLGLTPMARARLGLTQLEGTFVAAQLNQMIDQQGLDETGDKSQLVDITVYDEEEGETNGTDATGPGEENDS